MSYQFIHFDSYAREGSKQSKTVTKKNGDKITTTKQARIQKVSATVNR